MYVFLHRYAVSKYLLPLSLFYSVQIQKLPHMKVDVQLFRPQHSYYIVQLTRLYIITLEILFFIFWVFFFFINLFIYFWLCWVLVSVRGLSPAAASGGHSSSQCTGLSPPRPLLLQSTGSRRAGSVVVAHGRSRSAACGILPARARTRVPCIGRQILNHCATREGLFFEF